MQQPLNDRHKKAILLLGSGFSTRETAERCAVQLGTIYAWCKREDFREELNFLRNFATNIAKDELKGMLRLGLSNLRELLADEDKAVKYRAAELLFRTVLGNRVIETLGEEEISITRGQSADEVLQICAYVFDKILGTEGLGKLIAALKSPEIIKRPR